MSKKLIALVFLLLIFSSCAPIPEPQPTGTPQPTITLTATATIAPTATNTPVPTVTLTSTPEGYIPQVFIGISEEDIQIGACGDYKTIWTMNYGEEGEEISFWDHYPDIPKPEILGSSVIYGTRDWRGNMDICVFPERPIISQHEGIVLENRINLFTDEDQECLISIRLTSEEFQGYELIIAHFNPDIDTTTDGIQYITPGTVLSPGDIIGYTHQYNKAGETRNPVLNVGLFNHNSSDTTNFGYWKDQDLSLIGKDGQINLIDSE